MTLSLAELRACAPPALRRLTQDAAAFRASLRTIPGPVRVTGPPGVERVSLDLAHRPSSSLPLPPPPPPSSSPSLGAGGGGGAGVPAALSRRIDKERYFAGSSSNSARVAAMHPQAADFPPGRWTSSRPFAGFGGPPPGNFGGFSGGPCERGVRRPVLPSGPPPAAAPAAATLYRGGDASTRAPPPAAAACSYGGQGFAPGEGGAAPGWGYGGHGFAHGGGSEADCNEPLEIIASVRQLWRALHTGGA